MAIRGVIFDMDGTVTEPYLDFVTMKQRANIGDRDLLEFLETETGAERDRVYQLLLEIEAEGAQRAQLNAGAAELFQELDRRGLPKGLLTRNSRQSVDTICRKHRLKFDLISTREDGHYKPAPEPIWDMARQWQVKPAEVLMVGDYKWDILCAQNAGAPSVALLSNHETPAWVAAADHVIRQLSELMPIIEGATVA